MRERRVVEVVRAHVPAAVVVARMTLMVVVRVRVVVVALVVVGGGFALLAPILPSSVMGLLLSLATRPLFALLPRRSAFFTVPVGTFHVVGEPTVIPRATLRRVVAWARLFLGPPEQVGRSGQVAVVEEELSLSVGVEGVLAW